MKNQTVTSALKQSIVKSTGRIFQHRVYSDGRKKGLAVGVKVCYVEYSKPLQDLIVSDMESKGYKLAYVRYNKSNDATPSYFSTIPGTRFCFYKK